MLLFSRNAERDEEHFEMCVKSLEEEIMFNAGHLLVEEEPQKEEVDQPETPKHFRKKKPGRGFRHALSNLYIYESGRCETLAKLTKKQNFLLTRNADTTHQKNL